MSSSPDVSTAWPRLTEQPWPQHLVAPLVDVRGAADELEVVEVLVEAVPQERLVKALVEEHLGASSKLRGDERRGRVTGAG